MALPALALALLLQTPAQPPSEATIGVLPGGAWACTPEHEAWRVADMALLKAELPMAGAAAAELGRLEAALAHTPPAPLGGVAVCDGRTVAFNQAAALAALIRAARPPQQTGGAAPLPFSVEPRPMPYATLALLVGSIHASAGRYDKAVAALETGLAFLPDDPRLVGEEAFSLNKLHRGREAADRLAHAISVDTTAAPVDLARLHRTLGYTLGEMGRFDEAIAQYKASLALDPGEIIAGNEITYLQKLKGGGQASPGVTLTGDKTRKPGSPPT